MKLWELLKFKNKNLFQSMTTCVIYGYDKSQDLKMQMSNILKETITMY